MVAGLFQASLSSEEDETKLAGELPARYNINNLRQDWSVTESRLQVRMDRVLAVRVSEQPLAHSCTCEAPCAFGTDPVLGAL